MDHVKILRCPHLCLEPFLPISVFLSFYDVASSDFLIFVIIPNYLSGCYHLHCHLVSFLGCYHFCSSIFPYFAIFFNLFPLVSFRSKQDTLDFTKLKFEGDSKSFSSHFSGYISFQIYSSL